MTVETKTTIQLSDFATVEFECANCHSISSWPLNVAKFPPAKCHCSQELWMPIGGDIYRNITDLIELIKRFAGSKGKEPFILRFGLSSSVVPVSGDKD